MVFLFVTDLMSTAVGLCCELPEEILASGCNPCARLAVANNIPDNSCLFLVLSPDSPGEGGGELWPVTVSPHLHWEAVSGTTAWEHLKCQWEV